MTSRGTVFIGLEIDIKKKKNKKKPLEIYKLSLDLLIFLNFYHILIRKF